MYKIISTLQPRMQGKDVANLQSALKLLQQKGLFRIRDRKQAEKIESHWNEEVSNSLYGKATYELVRLVQEKYDVDTSGEVDARTAKILNEILMEFGELSEPDDKEDMLVSGHVIGPQLQGVPGQRLLLVDKNVGGDVQLADGLSGENGTYEIRYTLSERNKEKPDIQVKVLDAEGTSLAVSLVRYNADPVESGLDIMIPEGKFLQPAEYSRLTDELAIQLDKPDEIPLNQKLAQLKEDDQQQDITYLANKTGWDARMVAMTSLANQFAEHSGIEPEFYYALFRSNVPANDTTVYQMAPEMVRQTWELSIERHILPSEFKERIPKALEKFKNYAIERLLEDPAQIGISSFRELVASVLDDSKWHHFATLYYNKKTNLENFWTAVREAFPEEADRLQMIGKLGLLTINNVPLIQQVQALLEGNLKTPVTLIQHGFYQKEAWKELLVDDIPIPGEIPGEEEEEKRDNYASLMANQLRLSYPTAVVAHMVRTNIIPLSDEDPQIQEAVADFLNTQQGKFELSIHPIQYFLRENNLQLEDSVLKQIKKLQRVYQISPSDESMVSLLKNGFDSAQAIMRYDKSTFIHTMSQEIGDVLTTRLIFDKAHQVHHDVLNIAVSYLLEKSRPPIYSINNLPALNKEETNAIVSPTLENIFGEMDYCTCKHCRSWLSPAAYLVDILHFLDIPVKEKENPLDVLLERRPDIENLQLTCENTNTILPYIDLVNEILEHYVVNNSLSTYTGHNIEKGVTTEELLANPQFINDKAYEELREKQVFPPPLPFHQPLETLRRYVEHFELPLHKVMEQLRTSDDFKGKNSNYGWRDILIERLGISRKENDILADSGTISLQRLYGEDTATVDDLIGNLKKIEVRQADGTTVQRNIGIGNAKIFSRMFDLTYEEISELVRCQFVNPHSVLIPKLERLHISFSTIQKIIDGTLNEEKFNAMLPKNLDKTAYDRDVIKWLLHNKKEIMGLIVLSEPSGNEDICNFDTVEFRYAQPDFDKNRLKPIEFLKLLRFIRLWRKLGWSIEQTDMMITALYPADQHPGLTDDYVSAGEKLDKGFAMLLMRLAHLFTIMEQLHLTPKRDLAALLACWSVIGTQGERSLYKNMFLNPTILKLDDIFKEDGYGNYLADKKEFQQPGAKQPRLLDHEESLRGAFNLTDEEFEQVFQELKFDKKTILNLSNISNIFRHSYLARKLCLSVKEFFALKELSDIDPFESLDIAKTPKTDQPFGAVRPAAIHFIELAKTIKESPFKISQLLYFLRHTDLSGKASPAKKDILAFVRILHNDLVRIDREYVVQDDPDGEITKGKMTLVYGSEATDIFFGLLNSTSVFSVDYTHSKATLEKKVSAASRRIWYDDFQKKLFFKGAMTIAEKSALNSALPDASFKTAVEGLFDAGKEFFDRYSELRPLHDAYQKSNDTKGEKYSALLKSILPGLRNLHKRQQVRQAMSSQVDADLIFVTPLLEKTSLLYSDHTKGTPSIDDFLGLETSGLSADIYFADDVKGQPDQSDIFTPTIDYRTEGRFKLPSNPAGNAISGVWQGFLEATDNGSYNFSIHADTGSTIRLEIGEKERELSPDNGLWKNKNRIQLEAGRLYSVKLTALKIKNTLVLEWERQGMGRQVIPAGQLLPATSVKHFESSYLRLLKALAIVDILALSSKEMEYFATRTEYQIDGEGWLNALPTKPIPAGTSTKKLLGKLLGMLQYCSLKDSFKVQDDRLLEVLYKPEAVDEDGEFQLSKVTGWQKEDLSALLGHFKIGTKKLSNLEHFVRVHDAFSVIKKMGISAIALKDSITNEPSPDTIRILQSALRARYDQSAWLKVIQSVNDEMRRLQRDALVAFVLRRFQHDPKTAAINTADKLFEHFLIDVQMDTCMKTSRIKQAISSVQLFVQRCLLNMEPRVSSSSIKAGQWKWMNRYRVWEANRKVFLWPENWLEPELRDNKSPFFKDLESELLQGDITDDAAATALVHYLGKLDEVAKLEICGMYYEENEQNNKTDDITHIIARTAGSKRSYYYRRQENDISWTPWEKIDLNIEDNPVLPVVWKGRLFLFWVSVLQKALKPDKPTKSGKTDTLSNLKIDQVKSLAGDAKMQVGVMLNWSEYYHDKWQPVRTSDINAPLVLGDDFKPDEFDRKKLKLSSSESLLKDDSGALMISVGYKGKQESYYKLYNTHSLPIRKEDIGDSIIPALLQSIRTFSKYKMPLVATYNKSLLDLFTHPESNFDRTILTTGIHYQIIEPQYQVGDIFEAPFFFQDARHVFFVKSEVSTITVGGHLDLGIQPPSYGVVNDLPDLHVMPEFPRLPKGFIFPDEYITSDIVDTDLMDSFLAHDSHIDQSLTKIGSIQFGNRLIGPNGSKNIKNWRIKL